MRDIGHSRGTLRWENVAGEGYEALFENVPGAKRRQKGIESPQKYVLT